MEALIHYFFILLHLDKTRTRFVKPYNAIVTKLLQCFITRVLSCEK